MDGNFYGTTSGGGNSGGGGTIYRITPAGELTTLYSFSYPSSPNGYDLQSVVTFGSNGSLFGGAEFGGTHNNGTLYELPASGRLSVLYDFDFNNLSDGPHFNGLTLASDGNLYGTAGGSGYWPGAIYKVTESGKVSVFYTFCSLVNCPDGTNPFAPVIQGTDGNLYGTTSSGGTHAEGTVYQITPAGNLTTLYTFCSQTRCPDGAQPGSALMQATNGTFYSTTPRGGGTSAICSQIEGCGVLFSLSMGLSPFVEAVPNFGKAGATVNVLGNNLTGASAVTFDGVPATFKVISSTLLRVEVPTGAASGTIEVTTPSGVLNSNIPFHVLP
jgi:uncharacterized repeat protein (TIGR03803 family)